MCMKTCKKLLTLALALILLMSVLVLPAMAAPRYSLGLCNYCGGLTKYCGVTMIGNQQYVLGQCVDCGKITYFPQ